MMVSRARRVLTLPLHFSLQAVLCAGLWILVSRAYDLGAYPGRPGFALSVLLLGCVSLGALGRLPGGKWFVGSTAVALVSIVVLTEFYRVYVVDFAEGPPTFWVTLRKTAGINAPWAIGLAFVSLAGWYGTGACQRRWASSHSEGDGAA
jgi:hypothetical protein